MLIWGREMPAFSRAAGVYFRVAGIISRDVYVGDEEGSYQT